MAARNLFQGIDTIIVRVAEIKAAMDWYTQKLGLVPVWDDEQIRLVVMDTGGPTSLTLWETDQAISHSYNSAAYPIFRTENAAATRSLLVERGVRADELNEEEAVRFFRFFDPYGNMLEVCEVIEK